MLIIENISDFSHLQLRIIRSEIHGIDAFLAYSIHTKNIQGIGLDNTDAQIIVNIASIDAL